jgi:hypothetical protein
MVLPGHLQSHASDAVRLHSFSYLGRLINHCKQKNQALILVDHEISPNDNLPEEYLEPIKTLWSDAGVQKAVLKGNEYALHDNLS